MIIKVRSEGQSVTFIHFNSDRPDFNLPLGNNVSEQPQMVVYVFNSWDRKRSDVEGVCEREEMECVPECDPAFSRYTHSCGISSPGS